jgi:hypothetical protein
MKSTSSSTADWRKPLLEFLRNGASISVLSALTIVAGHNIHLSWSFSIGGPVIVFAMMLLVAIVATYANITCFFDGVVNSAMDKAGLGHRFDAIDKADINNMARVWTKLVGGLKSEVQHLSRIRCRNARKNFLPATAA